MSIVAMSETMGSLGNEIGRELGRRLSWEFADREIIAKAAERFGQGVMDLTHVTEEKPTLWERFADTKRHYLAYVEATIYEMALRDKVILSGRGATLLLASVRHALRVRVDAPPRLRAERVARRDGMTEAAAADLVEHADRERAARVKFLYGVDLAEPLRHDLVLNTERLDVERGVRLITEALADERFQPTPESRRHLADLSLAAQVKAALAANEVTRALHVTVACQGDEVVLGGSVEQEGQRASAEEAARRVAGVRPLRNEILVTRPRTSSVARI